MTTPGASASSAGLPRGKVIVAGCTHGGLSVIRSLGKRGLHVIAVTYNPAEHGLTSRYINEKAICPHPKDERAFVDFLLQKAPEWAGALILETNDFYATALSRHKPELAAHYRMLVPDWDVAQLFIEKDRTYALADSCGVPHPKVFAPASMDELEAVMDQIAFPVIIKPVRSHEFATQFRTKLFVVHSADDLRKGFQRTLDANIAVVVSEMIPGDDYKTLQRAVMYINTHGDIGTEMYKLKLRQTPPMFGISRVGVTAPLSPEARESALKILTAANYRGHASIEFKRDPRDQKLKLLEVNIRLTSDTQLGIAAGVDTPWIVYQDIVEDRQIIARDYQPNTYFILGVTDVADFVTKDKNRFRHFGRYLEPYLARHKTFAYFSRTDTGPFRSEVKKRFRRVVRKGSGLG